MTNNLEEQVQKLLAGMDEHNGQEPEPGIPGNEATEEIQDIYVLIVREHGEETENPQVVDSLTVNNKPDYIAFLPLCVFLLVIISTLAFQLYCIVNPPVATITIIPKSQAVTLTGTLQLGRLLNPITISQSQTTRTTGKGHQIAKAATGSITLYNGQFQNVNVAAGTIITGASGIQIVTDQDADIQAANPPMFGQMTISAHAINPGVRGNISAYDINQACCATSVLAKNTNPFTGGQNERDFSTVSTQDIHKISTPLKIAVMQGMSAAMQSQLTPQEQLYVLPCTLTIASDHPTGAEATQVKVTVSQTCSAVAYNSQELVTKATAFLAAQAQQKPGAGYNLLGTVPVSVKDATISTISKVFLSFSASGTWGYGLSQIVQQHIKPIIAGKSEQEALQLVASLPGVEQTSLSWEGFGDDTRLPKDTRNIHFHVIVQIG